VTVENLPEDKQLIRLADNIQAGEEGGYVYDEVVFPAPADRRLTPGGVEENFEAWWAYGSQDPEKITLEQRVSDLEEALLALMEG